MPVGDAVDERDDEIETRPEHRVEATEPLDHPRVLLWHHPDRLDDDDQRDDEQDERDGGKADVHAGISSSVANAYGRRRYGMRSAMTSVEPRIATMYIDSARGVSGAAVTADHSVPR